MRKAAHQYRLASIAVFMFAGGSLIRAIESIEDDDGWTTLYRFVATAAASLVGVYFFRKASEFIHATKDRGIVRQVGPNIYQSGAIVEGTTFEDLGVSLIFDLSFRPEVVPEVPVGCIYTAWPLPDREPPDPELLTRIGKALAAWSMDRPILIKCDMGINRSGLVVCETLKWQRELSIQSTYTQTHRIYNERFQQAIEELSEQELIRAQSRSEEAHAGKKDTRLESVS